VIVGRGANFLLPRQEILAVRIIAPLKVRAYRLAEKMGVSVRTARRAARDLDNRRFKFVRTMYRANVADPHHCDLVLDSESLGVTIAAELIVRAVELGLPVGQTVASGQWTVFSEESKQMMSAPEALLPDQGAPSNKSSAPADDP